MSVIVREVGPNIGPFSDWEFRLGEQAVATEGEADRIFAGTKSAAGEWVGGAGYMLTQLGEYTISADDELAPAPVQQPTPVPDEVPKWAVVEALIEANLDNLPETYINSLTGKPKRIAKNRWEKKTTIKRNSSILSGAITAGVITEAQRDELMIQAAQIATSDA